MGIVEVRQQMMAWSVATTVMWGIGGSCVALLNLLVGAGGSFLDPLVPFVIMMTILLVARK